MVESQLAVGDQSRGGARAGTAPRRNHIRLGGTLIIGASQQGQVVFPKVPHRVPVRVVKRTRRARRTGHRRLADTTTQDEEGED